MSKRKPPKKEATKEPSKKSSKKKTQSKSYELSADNLKAAVEEFMRTRSLLMPDETINTWFPAIKIDIVKEVSN